MNKLKDKFKKNGLLYHLLDRTDKVALYRLTIRVKNEDETVGYEVSKIYIKPSRIVKGKTMEASEALPSNDQFAWDDDSKCFFPNEPDRAIEYFKEYANRLQSKIPSNRLTV